MWIYLTYIENYTFKLRSIVFTTSPSDIQKQIPVVIVCNINATLFQRLATCGMGNTDCLLKHTTMTMDSAFLYHFHIIFFLSCPWLRPARTLLVAVQPYWLSSEINIAFINFSGYIFSILFLSVTHGSLKTYPKLVRK